MRLQVGRPHNWSERFRLLGSAPGGRRNRTLHHVMRTVGAGDLKAEPIVQFLSGVNLEDLQLNAFGLPIRFYYDVAEQSSSIPPVLIQRQDIYLSDPEAVSLRPHTEDADVLAVQVNDLEFSRFKIFVVELTLELLVPSPDFFDVITECLPFNFKAEIGITQVGIAKLWFVFGHVRP